MWKNFVFLLLFDTCDVVHNWSISLLPSLVKFSLVQLIQLHWSSAQKYGTVCLVWGSAQKYGAGSLIWCSAQKNGAGSLIQKYEAISLKSKSRSRKFNLEIWSRRTILEIWCRKSFHGRSVHSMFGSSVLSVRISSFRDFSTNITSYSWMVQHMHSFHMPTYISL